MLIRRCPLPTLDPEESRESSKNSDICIKPDTGKCQHKKCQSKPGNNDVPKFHRAAAHPDPERPSRKAKKFCLPLKRDMTLRIPKRMEAKRFDLQFSREDHEPLFDKDLRTVFETVKKLFRFFPPLKIKSRTGRTHKIQKVTVILNQIKREGSIPRKQKR